MTGRYRGLWLMAVAGLVGLSGCTSDYHLQGRVISGATSQVLIVPADDPRLTSSDRSAAGAVVSVTIDPDTIRPKRLPEVTADAEGFFAVPISETGAGFLLYEARVVGQRSGHRSADAVVPVPGSSKRVLVVLPRGRDARQPGEPRDLLRETLEEGRPYLEGRK